MTKTLENLVTGRHIHWVGFLTGNYQTCLRGKRRATKGRGGALSSLEFFERKGEHHRILGFRAKYNKFLS